MSNYPQYFLACPIANEGDKTIPPETSQSAGTGRLSQEKGWTDVNAQPIAEGGIPPQREDFNGALFLLSQLLFWMQQGGLFNYSTLFDYEVGNEVLLGGVKYRCIKANGPSSTTVSPTASNGAQYWSNQDVGSVRYDKAQSLSAGEKQQARNNIGVLASDDATFVRYDAAQGLNPKQQAQARNNIGVPSATEVDTKINNAVRNVNSAFVRAVAIGSSVATTTGGSQISVIVYLQAFVLLDNNNPSVTYSVRLNGSQIGTITLSFQGRRTGGAGFGRAETLSAQGYFYSSRTITKGQTVQVVRTTSSASGIESFSSEFAQVMVC